MIFKATKISYETISRDMCEVHLQMCLNSKEIY